MPALFQPLKSEDEPLYADHREPAGREAAEDPDGGSEPLDLRDSTPRRPPQ
jgi:hypothetical protein